MNGRMIGGGALAACVVLLAPWAVAQEGRLFDVFFAERDGALPCYGRLYTAEDLATVFSYRQISGIGISQSSDNNALTAPEAFEIVVAWSVRDGDTRESAKAACEMNGTGAVCTIDGDPGTYLLEGYWPEVFFTAETASSGDDASLAGMIDPEGTTLRLEPVDASVCDAG